jgi:hypothetical protein
VPALEAAKRSLTFLIPQTGLDKLPAPKRGQTARNRFETRKALFKRTLI